MLQCSFLPGLFLYQIHWTCNLVSEDFLHRDSSKFVAFLASSGMSFEPSIFINISRWENTAIHLKHVKLYMIYTCNNTVHPKVKYEFVLNLDYWLLLIIIFFQLLGAFIISFIAVMAVIGSRGSLPINFGTPGLVCLLSFNL